MSQDIELPDLTDAEEEVRRITVGFIRIMLDRGKYLAKDRDTIDPELLRLLDDIFLLRMALNRACLEGNIDKDQLISDLKLSFERLLNEQNPAQS